MSQGSLLRHPHSKQLCNVNNYVVSSELSAFYSKCITLVNSNKSCLWQTQKSTTLTNSKTTDPVLSVLIISALSANETRGAC